MSTGPFQTDYGSYRVGGDYGLPSEPWLLPITDEAPRAASVAEEDSLSAGVRLASRKVWLTANALCAVLALLLSAQIATDWGSAVSRPTTGQVAEATPPTIAVEKASLTSDHH